MYQQETYIYTHVHIANICMYICIRVCVFVCVYIVCVCVCVCTCVCMCVCTCLCVHTHLSPLKRKDLSRDRKRLNTKTKDAQLEKENIVKKTN